jgi:hypothetical protein
MYQQQLVPGNARRQRFARIVELGCEELGQGRLGDAHGAYHQVGGDDATRPVRPVTMGKTDAEQIVAKVVRHGRFSGLPEPTSEAVPAALEPGKVRPSVLTKEETGGRRESQKVLVEGGREGCLPREDNRRRAADDGQVVLVQIDELRQLANEARKVGSGQEGLITRRGHDAECRAGTGPQSSDGRGRVCSGPPVKLIAERRSGDRNGADSQERVLVLGVWGIRAILTPSNIYYITAIDLALSVVII